MIRLTDLMQRILAKHTDPYTKIPELILLGYCSNETAGEHISRYCLASKYVRGAVLDVASGTCYGSGILKRAKGIKIVVSVDRDIDALRYGRIVYDADCVCADAIHLPFREQAFESVVSLETLEHINDQKAFLKNIKNVLKKEGRLILSTPNKIFTSPFLPRPLNPYHTSEFYLGPLLDLLVACGFGVEQIYGGRRVKTLELLRRVVGSLIKFFLRKFSLRPYLLDDLYNLIHGWMLVRRERNVVRNILVDPEPNLFVHEELESHSNIIPYQYFLICAHL